MAKARSRLFPAGLAALAVTLAAAAPNSPAGSATPRPRLVLVVSVDQMRYDYLERFAPLWSEGLKTLLERGAVFTKARYRHSNCETGPGHSVLMSGRHARHTGIVANEWYDPLLRGTLNVVDDPAQSPVGGPGRAASPANFLAVTIGDSLKRASPGSRVVGVALKDRSAVLMTGRRADGAYRYDSAGGRFITSTYYRPDGTPPAWLAAWNAEDRADSFFGRLWTRLLSDVSVYDRYAGPDAVAGEWDRKDTVFPHRIRGAARTKVYYDDLRRTPFADELTLEVALRALDAHDLGRDDATDLLAVGFTATDIVGHTYGPDSHEILDQLLRLDRVLGRLFSEVDRRVGPGRTLVGLSADHGVVPLVELLQARGLPARRVHPDLLEQPVRKAVEQAFPAKPGLIAAFQYPHFYLDPDQIAKHRLKRAEVEVVVERAMLASGLVERVYTHARLLGDPPANDPEFPLFRNSFYGPRSPHLIARLKNGIYMDDEYPGGTGHDNPGDFECRVPVVFMGTSIRPGRYEAACGPHDIAPTLSRLLGLEYALEDGQRVLEEALR